MACAQDVVDGAGGRRARRQHVCWQSAREPTQGRREGPLPEMGQSLGQGLKSLRAYRYQRGYGQDSQCARGYGPRL